MKRLLAMAILLMGLALGGCATFCQTMTPGNLRKVSAAVHTIQASYDNLLMELEKNPTPEVKMAVSGADVVLAMFGNLRHTFCENEAAAANAAIVAQQVEQAVK
jgi:hypothetical protein